MKAIRLLVTLFLQGWASIGVAFKRLLTQPFLALASVAGLMLASSFILSVPLYADATYFRLLREELLAGDENDLNQKPVDYAPLAFTFELKAVGRGSPQWRDGVELDTYLSQGSLRQVDLPVLWVIRRFATSGFSLYPPRDPDNPGTQYSLGSASLAFITPLDQVINVVDGSLPPVDETIYQPGDPIPVMASEEFAEELGVQVGDIYSLRQQRTQIIVEIVGLWRPKDPKAAYWDVLSRQWFLVHESVYVGPISQQVPDELGNGLWDIAFSGSSLHSDDVEDLKLRIEQVQKQASTLMPQVKMTVSPLEALNRYQGNAPALTYLLYAFSVPIMGLIVAFISLVAGLFINQQRGEMAILRSRGASAIQVISMLLTQGILLGVAALLGGVALGSWITHIIGSSRSFMDFSAEAGLRIVMTPDILRFGVVGIAILMFVQVLLPSFGAAGNTIVSYKQERARSFRIPWWQRFWVDALLLIPAGYGVWVLQQQSQMVAEGAENIPDPLQNPLLMLVPALGIFAVALFTLRLVPRLMDFIGWVLRPTQSVGLLMASRYLSRTPAFYSAPLILLVLTLGLSAFTASLARTLDGHLEKQMRYQVGADMNLLEYGTTVNDTSGASFTFNPVNEHLSLEGVNAATRVGRYNATAIIGGRAVEGTFLGLDTPSFAKSAYWQRDFASSSLPDLLGKLASNPQGVLVPHELLTKYELKLGDTITLGIQTGASGESVALQAPILDTFELFPTWYPETGVLFVGDLDEFFIQAGGEYPHEVWLETDDSVDHEWLAYAVRGYSIVLDPDADQSKLVENGLNTIVRSWSSSELNIREEQRRPERQGLFGLLSVGFVASALLTVLGFLLYALFSFRRRFIEMGMLRAVGLSIRQMTGLLASELALLVLVGIGAGTLVGVFSSQMFVPFLQIGASAQSLYPPFQIEVAWISILQIYALFGALFLAALGALSALLVRMKIFQAIKLGETS